MANVIITLDESEKSTDQNGLYAMLENAQMKSMKLCKNHQIGDKALVMQSFFCKVFITKLEEERVLVKMNSRRGRQTVSEECYYAYAPQNDLLGLHLSLEAKCKLASIDKESATTIRIARRKRSKISMDLIYTQVNEKHKVDKITDLKAKWSRANREVGDLEIEYLGERVQFC